MEHYARAIQEVQEDMGLKTTSFPHLGIYGDLLVFYDHKSKTREIKVEIDHSHLKEKEQLEEEKEKLKDIQIPVPVPVLIEPDIEKGEELVTIADVPVLIEPDIEKGEELVTIADVPVLIEPDIEKGEELVTIADEIPQPQPKQRYRVKHENRMHLGRKRDEEWVCENCDEIVPLNKNHICRLKEANEDVITMTDDIPFEPSQEN